MYIDKIGLISISENISPGTILKCFLSPMFGNVWKLDMIGLELSCVFHVWFEGHKYGWNGQMTNNQELFYMVNKRHTEIITPTFPELFYMVKWCILVVFE